MDRFAQSGKASAGWPGLGNGDTAENGRKNGVTTTIAMPLLHFNWPLHSCMQQCYPAKLPYAPVQY